MSAMYDYRALVSTTCFHDLKKAYERGGEDAISREEYLQRLAKHYEGPIDECCAKAKKEMRTFDPFVDAVSEIVLDEMFVPLKDTTLLAQLFLSAFEGENSPGDLESLASGACESIPKEYYVQPTLYLASRAANTAALDFCFSHGATSSHDRILSDLQAAGRDDPEVLDVLYKADYSGWRTDIEQLQRPWIYSKFFHMGPACAQWWLAHGGQDNARHWMTSRHKSGFKQYKPPSTAVFKVLVDHFGISWFHNSGVLQFAAGQGYREIVQMLLDAGADVNEHPQAQSFDIREHPFAPLKAIHGVICGGHDTEMLKFLAAAGAKVTRDWINDSLKWMRLGDHRQAFETMVQWAESLDAVDEVGIEPKDRILY